MEKNQPKKRGKGRPITVDLDPRKVEAMATIGCSIEEIAHVMGCSRDTLERRFRDNLDRGKSKGKVKLRRLQWRSANRGDVRAQIWLGKQLLGQSDRQTVENINTPAPLHGELAKIATVEEMEQLDAILDQIEKRAALKTPEVPPQG